MSRATRPFHRFAVGAGLALAGLVVEGCDDDTSESESTGPSPESLVPDRAPLTRMTAEQYQNTLRDLFAPVDLGTLTFPVELEGQGGFENSTTLNTVTPALVEAYQRVAADSASTAASRLDTLLACDPSGEACGRDYITDLAQRAWRRPLTPAEQTALVSRHDAWSSQYGPQTAIELSIQYLLQSPEFIYFPRFGVNDPLPGTDAVPLTDWELASRLSYFIWNSMPDQELFDLAEQGRLSDRQVLAEQAFRMLGDWKAVEMVVSFHRQNWDTDEFNAIDLGFYGPVFEGLGLYAEDDMSDYYYLEYAPQARFEADVFLTQHVFYGDGKLSTLLTSNQTWVTPDTARLAYQTEVDTSQEPFTWRALIPDEGNGSDMREYAGDYYPVTLDPNQRAGYFTMVGFLGAKSGPQQPAPVRRGVTIMDRVLCKPPPPPPGDVPPLEEVENQEPKTNRDKYAIHTQSEACAACHRSIDGIGFTFENYDALGRWRDTDNGYPVDASGELLATDQDGEVTNAVGLMNKLAQSRTVHDCYVQQWYRYAFGREPELEDEPTLQALQEGFWQSEGDILELIVNMAGSYSFRHRSAQ